MSYRIPLELAEVGGERPLPAERPPEVGHVDRNRMPPLLTAMGLLFLTFNSGMAIYHSIGDYMAISLVAFCYMDILLLVYYLCWYEYERALPQSWRREPMKMAIWMLTTLLTGMFSYKVAAVMPLPAAVLVWGMAGAVVLGLYAFFVHQENVRILGRSRVPLPL